MEYSADVEGSATHTQGRLTPRVFSAMLGRSSHVLGMNPGKYYIRYVRIVGKYEE